MLGRISKGLEETERGNSKMSDKKTAPLHAMLSPEEKRILKARAQEMNYNVSDFIRQSLCQPVGSFHAFDEATRNFIQQAVKEKCEREKKKKGGKT